MMAPADSNTGFGPQAGPATIRSFTAANTSPGLAGSSTVARPSLMAGATAACSGAPPSSSTPANPEAAAAAPSL
jgi:hypothetical protein